MMDREFCQLRPIDGVLRLAPRIAHDLRWLELDRLKSEAPSDRFWPIVILGRLARNGLDADAQRAHELWLKDPLVDDSNGDLRAELWTLIADHVVEQVAFVRTLLERQSTTPSALSVSWTAIETRDNVESVLVVLGQACLVDDNTNAVAAERRGIACAASLDALAALQHHALIDALRSEPLTNETSAQWFECATSLDTSHWWIDLLLELQLSAPSTVRDTLRSHMAHLSKSSITSSRRRLQLRRPASDFRFAVQTNVADVIGCELSPAQQIDGQVVARMFNGTVEILARGLDEADPVPSALIIRPRSGKLGHIDAVSVEPLMNTAVLPTRVGISWWVPLGESRHVTLNLNVRYYTQGVPDAAEECLEVTLE